MPLVYRMPSLDRALQVAAILLGNDVQAREEVRCSASIACAWFARHLSPVMGAVEPRAGLTEL